MEDNPELIDNYLLRTDFAYEAVDEGTWVVHDDIDHVDNIVIHYSPPVVVFRVKLMTAPKDSEARAALCEKLLRLNAEEMVSGAYALEGENIIISEILQSKNLDFNEFQAAIDGLTMGIVQHYDVLKSFHRMAGDGERAKTAGTGQS